MHFELKKEFYERRKHHICMICANTLMNDARVLKTASSIRKAGYRITLYGVQPSDSGESVESVEGYDFNIYRVENPGFELRKQGEWGGNFKNYSAFTKLVASKIISHAKNTDFSLIYTHDMYGIGIGGIIKKKEDFSSLPWIHDVHEYVAGLTVLDPKLVDFALEQEKKFIHVPHVVTTVSPILLEILVSKYSINKTLLVPNCPRIGDYDDTYADIFTQCKLNKKSKIITYHGNVKAERGIVKFIDAFKYLPNDYYGAIITNSKGSYVNKLLEKVKKEFPGRIFFKPYVKAHKVSSYIRSSFACVHTINSYPNSELALPNKLFESLHANVPFVCPPLKGMKEFVTKYKNGIVAGENTAKSLALAVLEVEKNIDNISFDDAVKTNYSWENVESELVGCVDSILLEESANEQFYSKAIGKKISVCHLPAHSAGQAYALSHSLNNKIFEAFSFSISSKNPFNYPSDHLANNPDLIKNCSYGKKQLTNFYSFLSLNPKLKNNDIYHFHARSFWYQKDLNKSNTFGDAAIFKQMGAKVYMHFRGSEARRKTLFNASNPFSWFHVLDDISIPQSRRNELAKESPAIFDESGQKKFVEKAKAFSTEVLITDPEIGTYVPNSTILPRVISKEIFNAGRVRDYSNNVGQDKAFVIAHAPSRPFIKGTPYVVDAIDELVKEGYNIKLDLIQNTPHSEALKRYTKADLVIDQLRIGWYGVFSVEAMALGLPVICYIRDDLLHYLPLKRPLINANIENIKAVIKKVIEDPSLLSEYSRNARSYTQHMHHPDSVSRVLEYLYLDSWEPSKSFKDLSLINDLHKYIDESKPGLSEEPFGKSASNSIFYKAMRKDVSKDYVKAVKLYELYVNEKGGDEIKLNISRSRIRFLTSNGVEV